MVHIHELRALLEEEPDIRLAGQTGNVQEAIDTVRELAPNVVILNTTMPHLDGVEATRRILSAPPQTHVVAQSSNADKRIVGAPLGAGATS